MLHGEMDALERAGRLPAAVYRESVSTRRSRPVRCAPGAILLYGIPHVVVGENRTFMGEEEWLRSRGVRVDVVQDVRCIELMTAIHRGAPGTVERRYRGNRVQGYSQPLVVAELAQVTDEVAAVQCTRLLSSGD